MKKSLFILATAALVFASCNNDVKIDENKTLDDANEIAFRPLVPRVKRAPAAATDITTTNLASFNVTAFTTGTNATAYINDVTFTDQGDGTYTSTNKYYWPAGNLDFYAYYWDNSLTGVSKTNYRTFTVTPAVTTEIAGNQIDLVYAALKNKGKSDGTTGLPINFSHTGSKIALKVTHSGGTNNNVYFEVKAWGIGYLDNSGTFTFPDYSGSSSAETTAGTTLSSTYWSNNDAWATNKQIYRTTDLASAVKIGPSAGTPDGAVTTHTFTEEMILVPQGTIPAATKYQATTSAAKPEGSYVAVKMAVKNVADGSTIQSETWAMWPVSVNWAPGKKYTYNVTIDNGGYFEGNTNDGDDDLDPVLEGAVIYFASVTVSDWDAQSETNVTIPASNLQYGTSYTFNNANLASGTQTMTFNIGGLNGSKYIKVSKGGTDGAAQVASSTPTLDAVTAETGTDQTVTVTLNANAGSAKTMTITIQEYDDSEGNTASGTATVITINQSAS
jgi:hypothetical protein